MAKTNGNGGKTTQVSIEDGYLVVRVPLNSTPVRSATGKTRIVASTHGNVASTVTVDGQPVIVGLNAYIKG